MPARGKPFKFLDRDIKTFALRGYKIYPGSILTKRGKIYFLVDKNLKEYLVSNDSKFESRVGKIFSYNVYEKTHTNALRSRELFEHLNQLVV